MTSAAPIIAEYRRMNPRSASSDSSQKKTNAESAMQRATANSTARQLTASARKNSGTK